MATGQYIGVNGVARKVTAPYVGVNGVARNATSGYVGVNGVARLFFAPDDGGAVVLEVEKITSNTVVNGATYENEEFILLDIYPKTGGTVNITYGGLTKTITDTSGAEEPNAQQVFFGTFNGVTDSVATPSSGTLTIEGDYYAFGGGGYNSSVKVDNNCNCITAVANMGEITLIPDNAFSDGIYSACKLSTIKIPNTVISIGMEAFSNCKATSIVIPKNVSFIGYQAFAVDLLAGEHVDSRTVKILASTPPEIGTLETTDGTLQMCFELVGNGDFFTIKEIIVPRGCSNAYRTAAGWSQYADYIVEAI